MLNDHVLVCGLGALGQACLLRLVECGVPCTGLDRHQPLWRDPDLEAAMEGRVVVGDMRHPPVLLAGGATTCRAVLLLSSDSAVNVEAALQMRLLSSTARVVVRSSGNSAPLALELERRLPQIALVDPLLLCVEAVTTALAPPSHPPQLHLDGESLLLVRGDRQEHPWHKRVRQGGRTAEGQDLWLCPKAIMSPSMSGSTSSLGLNRSIHHRRWLVSLWQWLQQHQPSAAQRRVVVLLLAVLSGGVLLFSREGGWSQGLFVTLALLKGEYVDAVSLLTPTGGGEGPGGVLVLGTLLFALIGTLLTSALVALILERLLRDRLGRARSALPRVVRGTTLLIGSSSLCDAVSHRLNRQGRTVLRMSEDPALAVRDPSAIRFHDLHAANASLGSRELAAAAFLSSDLLTNLQQALALQRSRPGARLLVLAHAFGSTAQLGHLLDGVTILSAVDLVAEALIATAFGERVEGVLQPDGMTLLLVRFQVAATDTLHGRTIARLEAGYGLTAVTLRRSSHPTTIILPADDVVLQPGDALLVLASPAALRRVEQGDALPPRFQLRVRGGAALDAVRRFEAQRCLARWLGVSPAEVAPLLTVDDSLTPPIDEQVIGPLESDLRRVGLICTRD